MLTNNFFTFLKELSKNNNKEWFDVNRKTYEICKTHSCSCKDCESRKLKSEMSRGFK